jgi:hypothetical protein
MLSFSNSKACRLHGAIGQVLIGLGQTKLIEQLRLEHNKVYLFGSSLKIEVHKEIFCALYVCSNTYVDKLYTLSFEAAVKFGVDHALNLTNRIKDAVEVYK